MKKVISAILAVCLILCLSIPAFAAAVPTATFRSDTGEKVSLSVGKTYQFKITSLNGKKPTFIIPSKSFTVKGNGSKGHDFYFSVKAVGKVGDKSGVYIAGQKNPSSIITITTPAVKKSTYKVVTGNKMVVKQGQTYQFKVTSDSALTLKVGNNSVFKIVGESVTGHNYSLKIKAVGKKGQSTGIYVNGERATICTVG